MSLQTSPIRTARHRLLCCKAGRLEKGIKRGEKTGKNNMFWIRGSATKGFLRPVAFDSLLLINCQDLINHLNGTLRTSVYGKCAGSKSWPLASHYLHLIQEISQKMPPSIKRISSRNASKFSKSRHSSTLGHTKRVVTGDAACGSGSHPQSPRASAHP